MKKILAVVLSLVMSMALLAGCGGSSDSGNKGDDSASKNYKIAMITDYGDITDQSFNQTTYEACKAYADANKVGFQYYKPTGDSTEARVASFNNAVADGYNVIVVPGYAFGATIEEVAKDNPDVKIIGLDVNPASDMSEGYVLPENVATFIYQEELPGYMAGYAAVKEGYKKLGFLGGIAVPAVIRYGFGFVQGANDAAKEMGIAGDVEVNYVYGGQFFGDDAITAAMDTWYSNGTEVVFACGGGIYTSACEAAKKVGGKVIGVDVDQSAKINGDYGDGMCITSAMKGLSVTVKDVLTAIFADKWSDYAGKSANLGLVSADVETNYVALPTATWSMKNFTVDDYKALVKDMFDGKVKVNNDTANMPAVDIKVNVQANIH